MTRLLRRTRITGAVTPPPVGVAPTITSFSPAFGSAGTIVDVQGSNYAPGDEVRFGGVLASVVGFVSSGLLRVTVPSGALTGRVRVTNAAGFAVSVADFTVTTEGAQFEGIAQLPGPRLDDWKARARPVPDFAAIPGARRFTAASASSTDINAAIAAAAAYTATAGDRLVIVPDSAVSQVSIRPVQNTTWQTSFVHVVPASVANGTVTLTRDVRMSNTPPAWMPTWETTSGGVALENPVVTFQWGTLSNGFAVWGVNIRRRAAADFTRSCVALIDISGIVTSGAQAPVNDGNPYDPLLAPTHNFFSHCIVGGRRFDPSGRWNPQNLGRTFYDNGGAFACFDSWDVEHGAALGGGADVGIWSGIFCQGPTLLSNIATDFGGGIMVMHGGTDVSDYPAHEDFEVVHSFFWRDPIYIQQSTSALLDSLGAKCPWSFKNMLEIKTGKRVRWHRNFLLGQVNSGQESTIVVKAVNQSGRGRLDCTEDVAIHDNIVISNTSCVQMNLRETALRWRAKEPVTGPLPPATPQELATALARQQRYATDGTPWADEIAIRPQDPRWTADFVPGSSTHASRLYEPGDTVGVQRLSIRRNVFSSGRIPVTNTANTGRARIMLIAASSQTTGVAIPRGLQIEDNLFHTAFPAEIGVPNGDVDFLFEVGNSVPFQIGGVVSIRRNLSISAQANRWFGAANGNGMANALGTSGTPDTAPIDAIRDNWSVTSGGVAPANDGALGANNRYATDAAGVGVIVSGANRDVFEYAPGAPCRTGIVCGPDLAMLMALRPSIQSGVIA